MVHKIFYTTVLVFFILGCDQPKPKIFDQTKNYPEELQQLHRNIITNLIDEEVDLAEVKLSFQELQEDGTWPDIDYPSKTRGYWSPRFHLSRLLKLAQVYQNPGTEFYQKPEVSRKIHAALNHWLENDFQSPNWWHPVIGTPQLLNPTLMLMEPELSEDQIEMALPVLNRCEIGRTGQNKVWQSGNVLYTSMLSRNVELIKKASASIREELVVGTKEGVQPDWSYHQHGPQLQFGNYGLSYVGDMIKWISILRQTPFAFNENKVEILRNYLLHGQQWVIWKNEMDISGCGRQIGPDRPQEKAERLASYFVKMEKLDPEYEEEYKKAADYRKLTGNKHFWRSDIQVQRTPDYYFSVKMASNRVIGAESCNSENLQGYYLGDGATYLYQRGIEYKNIFPFWDWKKVPGTTTLQDEEPLPVLTARGYRIPSDFVGGVSNGENGIAVLNYNRLGLSAKKSWFMFDDKIVCLGTGIQSDEGLPVTTSVNQSYLNGNVETKKEGDNFKWILHDNIGYFFPHPSKMNLETDEVKGRWSDVTKLLSEDLISSNIFSLYFEHGVNPENDSYQYILLPNSSKKELEDMECELPFVITNSKSKQEVVEKNDRIAGIVFYEAGESELFGGLQTDQPCVVLLKKEGNVLQVSVADPTQKLNELHLTIKGNYGGPLTSSNGGITNLKITLPQNGEAGKTVTLKLTKL